VVTEGKSVTTDGVDYDNMYHFLFEFAADGRIRSIWEFHDTAHAGKVLRRGREGSVGLKAD
jgi:ketosteroid isomerase-like protein